MGNTRLGAIPKTRKWNELVEQVAGLGLTGKVAAAAASIDAIAAQTLDAAQQGLGRAAKDSGVCYTFYLITQLALASRTSDWEGALSEHGIRLSHVSSIFDFTSEVQDAIDRYISQNPAGATDLSEIAQQSAGEAITIATKHDPRRVLPVTIFGIHLKRFPLTSSVTGPCFKLPGHLVKLHS